MHNKLTDIPRTIQPLFLGRLLAYFRQGPSIDGDSDEVSYEEALYLAGAVVGLQALSTLCFNHSVYYAFHIGMKMKAATCSLIFRKVFFLLKSNYSLFLIFIKLGS